VKEIKTCEGCSTEYELTEKDLLWNKALSRVCWDCLDFDINLGTMDWRLFQRQRAVLIGLTDSDRLTEEEQETLEGLLSLTDHIIDVARQRQKTVPSLEDVTLDRLADV